jgi:hypothetical protein
VRVVRVRFSARPARARALRGPAAAAMSLSRLEKDAVVAEEARIAKLREKARADTADEKKLRKKVLEEEREHTRYCVRGAARGCRPAG